MGKNKKKYLGWRTLFRVKCVDPSNAVLLRTKWYDVINETEQQYLIRFSTGAANWYSKSRFEGIYYG